jgi:hypothetical protein
MKKSVYMNGGVSTTYITKKSSVYMNGGAFRMNDWYTFSQKQMEL